METPHDKKIDKFNEQDKFGWRDADGNFDVSIRDDYLKNMIKEVEKEFLYQNVVTVWFIENEGKKVTIPNEKELVEWWAKRCLDKMKK